MVTIFFSYSHSDKKLCKELEKHFSSLCDEGRATVWLDERVELGGDIDPEIIEKLNSAEIILLLISSDFLASKPCKAEMAIAMDRHNKGGACVIPVILRPCDWHNMPFGKLKATPTDGNPVTEHDNCDQGFRDIVQAIRQIVESIGGATPSAVPTAGMGVKKMHSPTEISPQSSDLRIKKEFTDLDRHAFLTESFNYIAQHFENSLSKLQSQSENVKTDFRRVDANKFEAIAFVNGREKSRCGICLSGRDMPGSHQILFSYDGLGIGSGFVAREIMSLNNDGFTLYLELMGMPYSGRKKKSMLTQEDAAKHYWSLFMEKLG